MIESFVSKISEFVNTNRDDLPILNIGFGANKNYLHPLGISLTSIALNNPRLFLSFHIFSDHYYPGDLERLKKTSKKFANISIYIYKINESIISHLPITHNYPLAIYYRILMPIILKNLSKILYLDCDVLCLQNIRTLVNLDPKQNIAAVVPDTDKSAAKRAKELNLPKTSYFNSGVMLINIPAWIAENTTQKILDTLSKYPTKFLLPDQDALNLLLLNKTLLLPKIWNYIKPNKYSPFLPVETKFLHYTGSSKPWKMACLNASQSIYLYYKQRSEWSEVPLDPPKNRQEMGKYCKKLLLEGKIIKATIWFVRYLLFA